MNPPTWLALESIERAIQDLKRPNGKLIETGPYRNSERETYRVQPDERHAVEEDLVGAACVVAQSYERARLIHEGLLAHFGWTSALAEFEALVDGDEKERARRVRLSFSGLGSSRGSRALERRHESELRAAAPFLIECIQPLLQAVASVDAILSPQRVPETRSELVRTWNQECERKKWRLLERLCVVCGRVLAYPPPEQRQCGRHEVRR